MQRALVIKVHGDKDIGDAIVSGMVSKELKELRAKVGVSSFVNHEKDEERIKELHARFPIKEHSERYDRFWGLVGLIWFILTERRAKRKER